MIIKRRENGVNLNTNLYQLPWQVFFFCRIWLNFCLSLSLTCAMFIIISSLLYNTMTFIFTSTFTSVSKPKIGLRKKSVFCVLLHNMCDFVPNLRLLFSFSRCTFVLQCTVVLVNFGVNILSLIIIVVYNVLDYLFCVCWSCPLKVT